MDFSLFANNGVEYLPQFLTSLAIGLLIGLERERTPSAKAGLRTFTLVALLGTRAADHPQAGPNCAGAHSRTL